EGVSISGDPNFGAAGKSKATISSPDVHIGNDKITISGSKITVSGKQEIVIGVGPSSVTIKPDGVYISGPKINSTAVGAHEISGALVKIN
ncbi:hypothetical protein K8R14_02585, partial [bacterium]|nr:hypothetical protein [bacterium]